MNISSALLSAVARWAQNCAESLVLGRRSTNESATLNAWLDLLAAIERGDNHIKAAWTHYNSFSSAFAGITISCYFLTAVIVAIGLLLVVKLVCLRKCATLLSKELLRYVLQGLLCPLVILNVYFMVCCLVSIFGDNGVAWGQNLILAVQKSSVSLHQFKEEIGHLVEDTFNVSDLIRNSTTAFASWSNDDVKLAGLNQVVECMNKLATVTKFYNDAFLPVLSDLAREVDAVAAVFGKFPIEEANAAKMVYNVLRVLNSYSVYWVSIGVISMTVAVLNASLMMFCSLTFCLRRVRCFHKIDVFMKKKKKLMLALWVSQSAALAFCVLLAIPSSVGLVAVTELCRDMQYPSEIRAGTLEKATIQGMQLILPASFSTSRLNNLHDIILDRLGSLEISFNLSSEVRLVSALPTVLRCDRLPLLTAAFHSNASAISATLDHIVNGKCEQSKSVIANKAISSSHAVSQLLGQLSGAGALVRQIGSLYFAKIENASCQSLNAAYETVYRSVCDGGRAISGYWFLTHLFALCTLPMVAISSCLVAQSATARRTGEKDQSETSFQSFDCDNKWWPNGTAAVDVAASAAATAGQTKIGESAQQATLRPLQTVQPPEPGYSVQRPPVLSQMQCQTVFQQPPPLHYEQAEAEAFRFHCQPPLAVQGSFVSDDLQFHQGSFCTDGFETADAGDSFADDVQEEKAMDDCEYFSTQELVVDVDESPYIDARELEVMHGQLKY